MSTNSRFAQRCHSLLLALAGCSVTTHDKGNGKKDDVDIKTPFGSLSVKEGA